MQAFSELGHSNFWATTLNYAPSRSVVSYQVACTINKDYNAYVLDRNKQMKKKYWQAMTKIEKIKDIFHYAKEPNPSKYWQ